MTLRFVDIDEVARLLPYSECIPLMREAMIALSQGRTRQILRSILDLPEGRAFGVMPGAMPDDGVFGAKLVSVYPDNFHKGGPSHQGVVALFDAETGAPVAILDAGEITAIRTAAASAAATSPRYAASARSSASRSGAAISPGPARSAAPSPAKASRRRSPGPTSSAPSPPPPSRSCARNGSPTAPMSTRSDRAGPARASSTTRSSPAPACSPTTNRASAPRAPNI